MSEILWSPRSGSDRRCETSTRFTRDGTRAATALKRRRLRGAAPVVDREPGPAFLVGGVGVRGGHRRVRRWAGARRRRPDAGREVVSPAPRLNFAENLLRPRPTTPPQSCSAERIASATPSASVSSGTRCRCSRRRCGRPGWRPAIALPATCPTCPRRSSRCSPPRASARSGRRPPPTSACGGSWIASARSLRRCCSARTATSTAASGSTPSAGSLRSRRRFRPSSASSSCPTPARPPTCPRWRTPSPSMRFVAGRAPAEIAFERLPFDHPLYVMYSSGTTGGAEVHRPTAAGRDAAPAHQGAGPAQRREARGAAPLLHDLRLDDVGTGR